LRHNSWRSMRGRTSWRGRRCDDDGRARPAHDQITGQPKFELFAESETKFFLKVVEAEAEFFMDASGAVTHMVIHQGGQDTKATRK